MLSSSVRRPGHFRSCQRCPEAALSQRIAAQSHGAATARVLDRAVHYTRRRIRFSESEKRRTIGTLTLDSLLDKLRPNGAAAACRPSRARTAGAIGRFVGRDACGKLLEWLNGHPFESARAPASAQKRSAGPLAAGAQRRQRQPAGGIRRRGTAGIAPRLIACQRALRR